MAESGELIFVRDFLQKWKSVISDTDTNANNDEEEFGEYVSRETGMARKMIEELSTVCGVETLACENEEDLVKTPNNTIPESGLHLLSTRCQMEELQKREDMKYNTKISKQMKYKNRKDHWNHTIINEPIENPENILSQPEVLLEVQVYRPFHKRGRPHFDQGYMVYGSMKLSEFRDKISCVSDSVIIGEYSENPSQPPELSTKELYKSGFFYIENTFYNDMRDSNNRDYSRVIMDWAKDKERGLGHFETEKMEETSFLDLKIVLGHPYLYLHQGDCEHLIIFTDLRLAHADDCQFVSQYPLLVFRRLERSFKCRICQMYTSRWVTRDSQLAPEDPGFFCETCFRSLHYDENGKKLGQFQAYHFSGKEGTA